MLYEVITQSSSNAGNPIYEVHRDLLGETDLTFVAKADFSLSDVVITSYSIHYTKLYEYQSALQMA